MFDKVKDLYALQKQARALKKALADEQIEVEAADGKIVVVITGEMKIVAIRVADDFRAHPELGAKLADAVNKAIEHAQKIAAQKMQEMGGLPGIPGMG